MGWIRILLLDPDPDQYPEPANLYPDPRPIKVNDKVKNVLVDLLFQSGIIFYPRHFVIKSLVYLTISMIFISSAVLNC
jgi:hypothetical protein